MLSPLWAQNNTTKTIQKSEKSPPDTVKIGMYLFSLYDLDFPGDKISADFYIWYNSRKDSLDLLQNFELVNSKEVIKSGETNEKMGDIYYQTLRCNSIIKKNWDVKSFPFDKQNIELIIEDIDKDNSKLVFKADSLESKIDKNLQLDGWYIKDFRIRIEDHTYETTYGDPSLAATDYSTYSRVIVSFSMERHGVGLFFKLFGGLFIAVLISMLTFFISPKDLDPRFGLPVGAIFASIASQYVISSTLPQNQQLTLVDILHVLSFFYIFLCILFSTISLHFAKAGKEQSSKKLDKYSFTGLLTSYILMVLIIIFRT